MQGQVLNKIMSKGRKLCWELFLANIWTEPSECVHHDFPSRVLVGHNNEVYYCRFHLCTGGLRCPNYSWDPNWATCTNQASESSKYKNGNFLCSLYFFPLPPAQPPCPPGSFSPLSWPRLTSTPACLCFQIKKVQVLLSATVALNITILFPTLCHKRFYTFWVWPLHFLWGKFLSQQNCAGAEIT